MSAPADIAVVIPVKDGAEFLAEAIGSVLRQTVPPSELVAVDDGSSDDSASIARRLGCRVVPGPGAGAFAARNTGIDSTSASAIAFLDQDDIWDDRKLELQVGRLQSDDFVLCLMRYFVADGEQPPDWLAPHMRDRVLPAIVPSALVARRTAFDRAGRFDATYQMAGDLEWVTRARRIGLLSSIVREPLVAKRAHAANLGRDVESTRREALAVARRLVHSRPEPASGG